MNEHSQTTIFNNSFPNYLYTVNKLLKLKGKCLFKLGLVFKGHDSLVLTRLVDSMQQRS